MQDRSLKKDDVEYFRVHKAARLDSASTGRVCVSIIRIVSWFICVDAQFTLDLPGFSRCTTQPCECEVKVKECFSSSRPRDTREHSGLLFFFPRLLATLSANVLFLSAGRHVTLSPYLCAGSNAVTDTLKDTLC